MIRNDQNDYEQKHSTIQGENMRKVFNTAVVLLSILALVACSTPSPVAGPKPIPTQAQAIPQNVARYLEILDLAQTEQSFWLTVPVLSDFLYKEYCTDFPGCVRTSPPKVLVLGNWEEFEKELGLPSGSLNSETTIATADIANNRILVNKQMRGIQKGIEGAKKGTYTYYQILLGMTSALLEEIYHLDSKPSDLDQPFELNGYIFVKAKGFGFEATEGGLKFVDVEEGSAVYVSRKISVDILQLSGDPTGTYDKEYGWFRNYGDRMQLKDIIALHRKSDPYGLLEIFYRVNSAKEAMTKFLAEYTK